MALNIRIALLLGLTVVTAASWVPLVVFPVSLASMLFVFAWSFSSKGSLKDWLLPILAFVQAGVYAIFITLPDFRFSGSALGNGGWQLPITFQTIGVSSMVFAFFAVFAFWSARNKNPKQREVILMVLGLFAVLGFTLPVFGFLLLQRVGAESLMGYYPTKFVGLMFILVAGILISQVAAVIPRTFKPLSQLILAVVSSVPLFWAGVVIPFDWKVERMTLAPTLTVATNPLTAEQAEAINRLVIIFDSDRRGANVVLDEDRWIEQLSNNYLIQLSVEQGSDPARIFFLETEAWEDSEFCDLVLFWERDVVFHVAENDIAQTKARFADCFVRERISVVSRPEI